jgi:hypothetical protein
MGTGMCISGGSRNFEKGGPASKRGGPPPEIAKNSRILGLKFLVLLTLDGKFWAKRGGPGPLGPPLNPPLCIDSLEYEE